MGYYMAGFKRKYATKRTFRKKAKTVAKTGFRQGGFKRKTFKRNAVKKQSLQGKAVRAGNHHWFSKGGAIVNNRKPFLKKLETMLAPRFTIINNAFRTNTGVGVQNAVQANIGFSTYDLNNIDPAPLVAGIANKFIAESCKMKTYFTNQSNQNIFVDIYDLVYRRDYIPGQDCTYHWKHGDSDQGAATAWQTIGSTPFQSEFFTAYHKVLKVTRTNLAQGESHEHVKTVKLNKMITQEISGNALTAQDLGGLKGWTHCTMLVYWGAPYNDVTTKTVVSTGDVSMDVISSKEYKYTYLQNAYTRISNLNALPAVFAAAEDIMNEDTGAAVAPVNA